MYAKTREECEEKLAELIKTMKAEIAAEKEKEQKSCSKQLNIGKKYRVFITFVMNTRYALQ